MITIIIISTWYLRQLFQILFILNGQCFRREIYKVPEPLLLKLMMLLFPTSKERRQALLVKMAVSADMVHLLIYHIKITTK